MNRNKKLIVLIALILLLIIGGVFWWWNQREIRELNQQLPDGVRVVKSLLGDYRVINEIDRYEFKVPRDWKGVEEIYYTPERIEQNYVLSTIELEGNKGESRIMVINRFKTGELNLNLKSWAKVNFETFGLVGNFSNDKVKDLEIVKTKENTQLLGMNVYFFRTNSAIYAFTGGSEDFIKDIITDGKW